MFALCRNVRWICFYSLCYFDDVCLYTAEIINKDPHLLCIVCQEMGSTTARWDFSVKGPTIWYPEDFVLQIFAPENYQKRYLFVRHAGGPEKYVFWKFHLKQSLKYWNLLSVSNANRNSPSPPRIWNGLIPIVCWYEIYESYNPTQCCWKPYWILMVVWYLYFSVI